MLKKTQKKKKKLHLAKQLELRLIKFIPSIHSFVCLYHKLRIKQTVIPDKSSNYWLVKKEQTRISKISNHSITLSNFRAYSYTKFPFNIQQKNHWKSHISEYLFYKNN